MSEISPPASFYDTADSLGKYLQIVSNWHRAHSIKETQFLGKIWFRGNGKPYPHPLCPGVYRDDFANLAKRYRGSNQDEKGLNLEREMLYEFRTSGAVFLRANDIL